MLLHRRHINNIVEDETSSLFPLYINLSKVSNTEYKCNPTPETIALADYINENKIADFLGYYTVEFPKNSLIIDGIVVEWVNLGKDGILAYYYQTPDRGFFVDVSYIELTGPNKGMLIHFDDD